MNDDTNQRDEARAELDKLTTTVDSVTSSLKRAIDEREEARAEADMYGTAYHAIQKVLDGAIGGGVDDGEGAGIVADVALVVTQRDDARRALERVATERDEARAEVRQWQDTYGEDALRGATRILQEREELRAEVVRLGRALERAEHDNCGCLGYPLGVGEDEVTAAHTRLRAALDEERIEGDPK